MRKGYIYYNNDFAGTLYESDDDFKFIYDDDYFNNKHSVAISKTIPLTQKNHNYKELFPFMDGLIPEGHLLGIAISKWSLNQNDRMGLLLNTCEDCIGAVSVFKIKQKDAERKSTNNEMP